MLWNVFIHIPIRFTVVVLGGQISPTYLELAFGKLSAGMDPGSMNQPCLASNQPNDRWMDDFQSIHINSQTYQSPPGFDQFSAQIEAARLGDEMPFGGVDGSFEGFGFEVDIGTQMDMPNYLNGFFSGTATG
jgi:hypothetical protein